MFAGDPPFGIHLGEIIRAQHRFRLAATVALVTLAAATLSGCSFQGNAAEKWLGESQIIESTDVNLTGCSALCDPVVEGTISESASEEQIRALSDDAAEYLADTADDVEMNLEYRGVRFTIPHARGEVTSVVDLTLTASTDDRVSSAWIGPMSLYLDVPKAALTSVYSDYNLPENPAVRVINDDGESSFRIDADADRCGESDSLIPAFDALLLDPAVTAIWLEMCSRLEVTVADVSARDAVVAQLQPFASDPSLSSVAFSVLTPDDVHFSVTADTPLLTPLLTLISSTPGVDSYGVSGTEIEVEISDPSLMRSIVAAIETVTRPDAVDRITISGGGISIYLDDDGTADAQLSVAEAMVTLNASGDTVYFAAQPSPDDALTFTPTNYTDEIGQKIVDAVIASGLWTTSSTEIAVFDRPVIFTVVADAGSSTLRTTRTNADDNLDTTGIVSDLTTYWAEQQAASR